MMGTFSCKKSLQIFLHFTETRGKTKYAQKGFSRIARVFPRIARVFPVCNPAWLTGLIRFARKQV